MKNIKLIIEIVAMFLSIAFVWGSLYTQLEYIKKNSDKALEISYKNSLDIEYIKGILKNNRSK